MPGSMASDCKPLPHLAGEAWLGRPGRHSSQVQTQNPATPHLCGCLKRHHNLSIHGLHPVGTTAPVELVVGGGRCGGDGSSCRGQDKTANSMALGTAEQGRAGQDQVGQAFAKGKVQQGRAGQGGRLPRRGSPPASRMCGHTVGCARLQGRQKSRAGQDRTGQAAEKLGGHGVRVSMCGRQRAVPAVCKASRALRQAGTAQQDSLECVAA